MPDGVRLAGFVPPGIEVNQVFGSLTARCPDQTWIVEVPGGFPGPYLVFLTGIADGAVHGQGSQGWSMTGRSTRESGPEPSPAGSASAAG